MVVKVVTDAGPIPTITPRAGREQARLNAAEFKQLCNAALALLDPLRASKTRGYLPSGEYARMVRLDRALRTAHAARTHASRVKTLRAVVGDLRVSDPIAAVAVETHTTIATAQPIADVPFSLQPTSATRAATQTTLF